MELFEKYLINTKEKNYNIEHLDNIRQNSTKLVYEYVMRSLNLLNNMKVNKKVYSLVSEALKWMDVSKAGTKNDRKRWKDIGCNLYIHNIASSIIYKNEVKDYNEIVYILIKTHGLIGQYIRGETSLISSFELYELIDKKLIDKDLLKEVLLVFNECLIKAVSDKIYNRIKKEIEYTVDLIVNNKFNKEMDIIVRINRLNGSLSDDNIKELKDILKNNNILERITNLFSRISFWYYEIALNSFSILEQIKILLICYNELNNQTNITFEKIMKSMYIDYNDKKVINLFKKRIIEEYLSTLEIDDILNNNLLDSPHISFKIYKREDTLVFDFKFSLQASKLIDFCMVASNSNALYKKSIYMLYDLFGFRRDSYDRFYNELNYLNTMNSGKNEKSIILNYLVGKKVLDVGPGGGVLLDLIENKSSDYDVWGIDLSQNVIDKLNEKKSNENHKWNIVKGDALNLTKYFEKNSVDSIIYSSIIHELYSYIEFDGKKFNKETIKKSLKEAYEILKVGGRIIIRDGIMSEPVNSYRLIEFKNIEDINILNRYCNDFKGRNITYKKVNDNTVKMLLNDAMEFLYTYTWGEQSYPLEVQEQFGYFTLNEYVNFIKENLVGSKIIESKSFLQEGYEKNLLNKISIYDENFNVVKLPDSTSIIVIEKG